MDISKFIHNIVPITQFNKGKASQMFSRANKGETLVVVRNNKPVAIIMSTEEYVALRSLPHVCKKLKKENNKTVIEEINCSLEKLEVFDGNGEKNV